MRAPRSPLEWPLLQSAVLMFVMQTPCSRENSGSEFWAECSKSDCHKNEDFISMQFYIKEEKIKSWWVGAAGKCSCYSKLHHRRSEAVADRDCLFWIFATFRSRLLSCLRPSTPSFGGSVPRFLHIFLPFSVRLHVIRLMATFRPHSVIHC